MKTSATSCSLNGLNGIGWAGLMCDFAEKRKLKSIFVRFLFPFSHPLLTLIPDILPPSLSSVRLTEQETPVRVKMKELQGRWMCAERVCEMNECPLVPYPHRRCPAWTQKPKNNNMTTGQNGGQIVVRLLGMQFSSHIHSCCTPCSSDSRSIKTQPTALSKDASV